jgi:hypothetical protein
MRVLPSSIIDKTRALVQLLHHHDRSTADIETRVHAVHISAKFSSILVLVDTGYTYWCEHVRMCTRVPRYVPNCTYIVYATAV